MQNESIRIVDKKTYKYFIACDDALRPNAKKYPMPLRDSEQRFQRIMRKTEYRWNTRKKSFLHMILAYWSKTKYIILCKSFNVDIPINVFGPGLIIWHLQGITVNSKAKIGRNFSISKGCTIGQKNNLVPVVGDNCEMMINSSILGEGILADGVAIGAHTLVIKPIMDSDSTWAGVPAKKIHNVISSYATERIEKTNSIKF